MTQNSNTKKELLLIVEGANDEVALGMPLKNLQKVYSLDKNINIGVMRGDITSDFKIRDVKEAIEKRVENYRKEYKLKKNDICGIVLLVDMDGAYIPSNAVVEDSEHTKPFYGENTILHNCPNKLQATRNLKQQRLNSLINLDYIWGVKPFSVFFVSCNLDHVICRKANPTDREKRNAADDFSIEFGEDAERFLSFFHSPELVLGKTLDESWDIIRQDLNSLQRHSNLNFFLDTLLN